MKSNIGGLVGVWFRRGNHEDQPYEQDFVIETSDRELICEVKRADKFDDPIVLSKKKQRKNGVSMLRNTKTPYEANRGVAI